MNEAGSRFRWRRAGLLVLLLGMAACSESGSSAGAAGLPPPPAPDGAPPLPTDDATAWSPSALDEILAPVALYPDTILAQVLAASTNAQEVLDAGNWLLEHPELKDDALTKAAADLNFSPAVQALVHFPTVVDMMCRELDWTKQLGDAFSADQGAVLTTVQRLRKQAADAGNLVTTPEMKVETTQADGKEVIVLQPANPQIIYVPQYNPVQVYTPPPTTTTTTTTTTSSGLSTGEAVVGGLLAFTAGVLVANAFDDNHNNNYCYPNWGYGGVYYSPRPYYPHTTFVYAPRYPGYRPAYGYRPPANYPAHYNNYQRNTVNNINVNVNNNNYFNRFDKNQNRVSTYQPQSPAQRPGSTSDWKGRNSYAGTSTTRPNTQRPAPAASTRPAERPAGQPAPRGDYAGARPATPSSRPADGQRPGTAQGPSPGQRPAAMQRPAASRRPAPAPDRGYPQTTGRRSDAATAGSTRGGGFTGATTHQASRDRAASQRGKSSMGAAPRSSNRSAPQRNRSSRG